ncbi:phosphoribosyl-ATP diphosphatase [Candidatus Vidania fulgoroideorum]
MKIIKKIINLIKNSKNHNGYSYSLIKNKKKMERKILEESFELICEIRKKSNSNFIHEFCDLLYHMLVALVYKKISFNKIKSELLKRMSN